MARDNIDIAALIMSAAETETPEAVGDIVTVRTPTAETHTHKVSGPVSIKEVLTALRIGSPSTVEYWVDGNKVPIEYTIPAGSIVTMINGNVKGG